MGRITIFTADACPHSNRVRYALRQAGLPWTEISTDSPQRRSDMIHLSGRISTPQVFFNTRHVGDADATIRLIQKWETDKKRAASALERYEKEIDRFPDPQNPRFKLEEGNEKRHFEVKRTHSELVLMPGGRELTTIEMIELLKKMLPRKKNKEGRNSLHWMSFIGTEAIQAFEKNLEVSEDKARVLLKDLIQKGFISHIQESTQFEENKVFCLFCDLKPDVLNSFCSWKGKECKEPMDLVHNLKRLMNRIEGNWMGDDGLVDLVAAKSDPLYSLFEEAACELQVVDLSLLDENTKFAFGINLYNIMIKYSFIKVGTARSDWARFVFYNSVKFNVGGDIYSFQDWENGILRRNRKAPYALRLQFQADDPRQRFMCTEVKPETHFGLNCGARSCPPITQYTAENLDHELKLVGQAFFENDEHIQIDEKRKELRLSQIFKWYIVDFVESGKKADLPGYVVKHLTGVRQQKLEKMMDKQKVKVSFMPYDWSIHTKKALKFDGDMLNPKKKAVLRVLAEDEQEDQTSSSFKSSSIGGEDHEAINLFVQQPMIA